MSKRGRRREKMYWRTAVVTLAFLIHAIPEMRVIGQVLDVCATCHSNATCDDKIDGTGKVCNCIYGFVGNGRTFCQDKDECQIGANKICGQHTACHNTYGSYYCTCMAGYSPSNNMALFIPNDGSHCRDIDECRVQGICGEGGQCRNTPGDFNCHCQLGYQVENGAEPFHPHHDNAVCKAIDCGQPRSPENAVQLSATGTRYGSVAKFGCMEGFLWRSGEKLVCGDGGTWKGPPLVCEEVDCGAPPALPHSVMLWDKSTKMNTEVVYHCDSGYRNVGEGNVSVCNANGQWEKASLRCEEITCGAPPILPHTGQVWNGSTHPGSTVLYTCEEGFEGGGQISYCTESSYWSKSTLLCKEITCGDPPTLPHTGQVWNGGINLGSTASYYCKEGFYSEGGDNHSYCARNGYWTKSALLCKEVDCGAPPALPHSVMLWDKSTKMNTEVVYHCDSGYRNVGEGNVSVCNANGQWEKASFLCEEIDCGEPKFIPHSKMLWDQTSRVGSGVHYQCVVGYYSTHERNAAQCGENGLWEDIELQCEEINCGSPLILPSTNMLWDRTTGQGSVVEYVCKDGFYQESGDSLSTCTSSGQWGIVSVICKVKCGRAPAPPHSEVVWQNSSVVLHGCVDGYHSWRGRNTSVCDVTGRWQGATLRCREIKPAIDDLVVFNEKCLRWKAEKYEEDREDYKVVFVGFRDYERTFRDKRKRFLSSTADRLEMCLNLLPVTNYTITITATSVRFTTTITANTSLQVPQAPEIVYREVETPVPTLCLRRSTHTLDPISFYQVFVLPLEGTLVFDCASQENPDFSSQMESHGQYITAQIHLKQVRREINFTVGDGLYYGGFNNAPLQNGKDYYIILRAVSQWGGAFKHSCVIWAKVRGTSYVLKVLSLFAGGSIGLFALAIVLGSCYTWFCKKP